MLLSFAKVKSRVRGERSLFNRLPIEIVVLILSYLETNPYSPEFKKALVNVSYVSHRMFCVAQQLLYERFFLIRGYLESAYDLVRRLVQLTWAISRNIKMGNMV